jgi:DNA-directed RNA polymerase specialized sigma24 family protein
MEPAEHASEHPDWQQAMNAGDREAFQAAARPHLDRLLTAARHDLDYYVDQGELHPGDFTPEEVAGEALIYAWDHRDRHPDQVSLEGWLLGAQHRLLRSMVREAMTYREEKALSLDEQIPADAKAQGNQTRFQYGHQPEEEITWEDVTPGSKPVDVNAPLYAEDSSVPNEATFHLDPDARHAVMMHDEFEMDLAEVAFTMEQSVQETAALLEQARTSLHERQGAAPTEDNALSGGEVDAPADPDKQA